jgi:hypothetical protein
MHVRLTALAALLIFCTVACGGGSSPSAPSAPSSPTLTGATIQGQVQTVTGTTAATTGAAAAGLKVTVVGTSISDTVSGLGQFVLKGVPAGSNQLTLTGPGVDATVSFIPVTGTETITLTVRISGNHAEVEQEEHDNHGDLQINGTVSNLAGNAQSFSFMVGTRTVNGDNETSFFGDGNRSDDFADLRDGARVEVKAAMRDTLVYAQRIHINGGSSGTGDDDHPGDDEGEDDEDHAGEVEMAGIISDLTAGCPSISFKLNVNTTVTTNASTEFKGAPCAALANGDQVKVEGTRQANGAILAEEVKSR